MSAPMQVDAQEVFGVLVQAFNCGWPTKILSSNTLPECSQWDPTPAQPAKVSARSLNFYNADPKSWWTVSPVHSGYPVVSDIAGYRAIRKNS